MSTTQVVARIPAHIKKQAQIRARKDGTNLSRIFGMFLEQYGTERIELRVSFTEKKLSYDQFVAQSMEKARKDFAAGKTLTLNEVIQKLWISE